jgi:hypothetical protein
VASEIAPVTLRRARASARSFVSAGNLATSSCSCPRRGV